MIIFKTVISIAVFCTMVLSSLNCAGQILQEGTQILKTGEIVQVKFFKNYKALNESLVNKADFIRLVRNDTAKDVFPKDILGFDIGKKSYKSIVIKNNKEEVNIFCEVLEEGKALLYYYNGNILGQKEIYIFSKLNEPQYYVSLEEKLKGGGQNSDASGPPMPTDMNMVSQLNKIIQNVAGASAFKNQFLRYFSDCPEVKNKLKLDWYTSSSIRSLFEDYNSSCGK